MIKVFSTTACKHRGKQRSCLKSALLLDITVKKKENQQLLKDSDENDVVDVLVAFFLKMEDIHKEI